MITPDWQARIHHGAIPWLLEPDPANPGPRYFALIDLLGATPGSAEALKARADLMRTGPVPAILAAQTPEGYWVSPGPGYNPKYRGTVWSVTFFAQLGADGSDPRVKRGCDYVLEHALSPCGGLSMDGANNGMIQCLQGNLIAALADLGWASDERFQRAAAWLARSITGSGIAPAEEKTAQPRYYRSGNSGPGFACAGNNNLPCAWGAVKAVLAMSRLPPNLRDALVNQAASQAAAFLLAGNPVKADYPRWQAGNPSRSWFQFGYPIGYVTDVLQNLEALAALGCTADPRMAAGVEYVLSKQDAQGRWKMEYTINGKTWADIEQKGAPSKWITLRALRLVKAVNPGG